MSTQTIVIGQPPAVKAKIPIKFEERLDTDYKFDTTVFFPNGYKYVELICQNYSNGRDLMFAYSNPEKRGDGTLYIGKWNDGVVE